MCNTDFINLIQSMDIGLQVSYTESFNIVTANFVNNNKIIIVSEDIDWMPSYLQVCPTDYNKLIDKIMFAYRYRNNRLIKAPMLISLINYNNKSQSIWTKFLNSK
jgi:hypothetical protein